MARIAPPTHAAFPAALAGTCSGACATMGLALGGSASSRSLATLSPNPALLPAPPAHPPLVATASRHARLCSGVHAWTAARTASETPPEDEDEADSEEDSPAAARRGASAAAAGAEAPTSAPRRSASGMPARVAPETSTTFPSGNA